MINSTFLYLHFRTLKKCVRLMVAPMSRKHTQIRLLVALYLFLLFFICFIPSRRKLFYSRSSFHREPSWLIANAIITLKTTRHVGTESRKYAKLARDRGKKYDRSVFQNYTLIIFDAHAGVLIMHDAFNFDCNAQY